MHEASSRQYICCPGYPWILKDKNLKQSTEAQIAFAEKDSMDTRGDPLESTAAFPLQSIAIGSSLYL